MVGSRESGWDDGDVSGVVGIVSMPAGSGALIRVGMVVVSGIATTTIPGLARQWFSANNPGTTSHAPVLYTLSARLGNVGPPASVTVSNALAAGTDTTSARPDTVLAPRGRGRAGMRVVVSITQRSFARFVAFDLAVAARRLGWAVHWIDFDALTQQLAGSPRDAWLATLARVTDEVRAFAPDVVFSYGIEAILPPFPDVLPDDPLAAGRRGPRTGGLLLLRLRSTVRPPGRRDHGSIRRAVAAPGHPRLLLGSACRGRPRPVRRGRRIPADGGQRRDVPPAACRGHPRPADRVLRRPDCPSASSTLRSLAPAGLSVYGYDEPGWTADPVLARLLSRLRAGARPSARDVPARAGDA